MAVPIKKQSQGLSPAETAEESPHGNRRRSDARQQGRQHRVVYGELILLGYNGRLPKGDDGRHKSKFTLEKRPVANGVKVVGQRNCVRPTEALKEKTSHSIAMTLSRDKSVVIDYDGDSATDMFQVGYLF
jgi:hypothetical protein